jgi:AraC-like DNA-binding protein
LTPAAESERVATLIHVPSDVQMLSDAVTDAVLTFVQQSQVAVGVCAEEDYVAQVSALWTCLAAFPRGAVEADLVAATIAVCRIATGFFVVGDHRNSPKRSHGDRNSRRTSVNNVLCLAREQYFCADLTLGGLAKHLGLSGAYLSRALAAETGHPFRTHLNGIRLLAAVARLPRGLAPLSAIATQVGYPRTGELDRQFHRWFRLSPRQFRTLLGALPRDRLLGPAIEPARPL